MPTTAVEPSTRTHSWSLVNLTVMRFLVCSGLGGGAAIVAMRNERQRRDARGSRRAADHQSHTGADLGMGRRHIGHGDGCVDTRAKAAAGDAADDATRAIDDLGAFARGRPSLRPNADA